MKKGSTLFLKVAVIILGLIVLSACIFALPEIHKGGSAEFPQAAHSVALIVMGLYATAIPFFIAVWQTLKLLNLIDQNRAFSELSITALKNIKYCAFTVGLLYMGGLPLLLPIAEADDAPGLLLIGFAISCTPFVVAVFAAVLERLLQNAIDVKSENDLTV